MRKYKRVTYVEQYLSVLLTKGQISKVIRIGNLPATLDKTWSDMVLVDVQPVQDYDAYAKCNVNIFLYAKPVDRQNTKPFKRLDEMEDILDSLVNSKWDKHYTLVPNWKSQDYDNNIGYFFICANISVIVKP